MKIALIQIGATDDKDANLAKVAQFVLEAANKGASLIALPEVVNFRGNMRDKAIREQHAETIRGKTVIGLSDLARRTKAWILLGSFLEKGIMGKVYNTSVLFNPKGIVQAKYRKINLFDARIGDKIIRESDCMLAGTKPMMSKIDGFTAGMSICYDVRFAKLYETYRNRQTDMLFVPACFTKQTGQAHWEVLLRARAIENLAYVVAPNQVGSDWRGVEAYGNSMIVDPWGQIIARGSSDREEIVLGDIERGPIEKARQTLPGIVNKRF